MYRTRSAQAKESACTTTTAVGLQTETRFPERFVENMFPERFTKRCLNSGSMSPETTDFTTGKSVPRTTVVNSCQQLSGVVPKRKPFSEVGLQLRWRSLRSHRPGASPTNRYSSPQHKHTVFQQRIICQATHEVPQRKPQLQHCHLPEPGYREGYRLGEPAVAAAAEHLIVEGRN